MDGFVEGLPAGAPVLPELTPEMILTIGRTSLVMALFLLLAVMVATVANPHR